MKDRNIIWIFSLQGLFFTVRTQLSLFIHITHLKLHLLFLCVNYLKKIFHKFDRSFRDVSDRLQDKNLFQIPIEAAMFFHEKKFSRRGLFSILTTKT